MHGLFRSVAPWVLSSAPEHAEAVGLTLTSGHCIFLAKVMVAGALLGARLCPASNQPPGAAVSGYPVLKPQKICALQVPKKQAARGPSPCWQICLCGNELRSRAQTLARWMTWAGLTLLVKAPFHPLAISVGWVISS